MGHARLIPAVAFCCALLAPPSAAAHESPALDAADITQASLEQLGEMIVVTVARHEQRRFDAPRSVSIVTAAELERHNYRTVPEALIGVPGVLVQQTNYGGGSPIIRGLIGNQILILVDGVRLNNAIYRLGPNQYLNLIDIRQVERIEVIHGTGSVLYGSDALGGVVNIITRSRAVPGGAPGLVFAPATRLASADRSADGRIELSAGTDRTGLNGGVSLKDYGDLRAGSDIGRQAFTGYRELDGDFKLLHRFSPRASATIAAQRVVQRDVPRTDILATGDNLQYEWAPQERTLGSLRFDFEPRQSFVRAVSVGTSHQIQNEEILRVLTSAPTVRRRYHDRVATSGFMLQLSSARGVRQVFTYGGEYYRDQVTSLRHDRNLVTGVETPRAGTFADGARTGSAALFVLDEVRISDRWSMNLGLRHSRYDLVATVADPARGTVRVHYHPFAVTGSARALFRLAENLNLIGGVSQGFRAPNVDDASVQGSFGGGYEVPNPRLDPERSIDYELGTKAQHGRSYLTTFGFVSDLRDIIQRETGTYAGLPFLDLNDNRTRDAGEPLVFQRQKVGRARIVGLELETLAQLREDLALYGSLGWVRGDDRVAGVPLRRIPPTMGTVGTRWSGDRLWLDLYGTLSDAQRRLAPGDRTDSRIRPGGTPGFATLNLRGGVSIDGFGTLTLGLENLTDASYRLHGSGIDAPGFNVVFGYRSPGRR